MRRWTRSNNNRADTAANTEVSAWLEEVSDQLDQGLAENEIERGVNLYRQKVRAAGDGITGSVKMRLSPAAQAPSPTPNNNSSATEVVIYREGISKGRTRLVGGYRVPLRSVRASWTTVTVQIDHHPAFETKTGVPYRLALAPGQHRMWVAGHGFSPVEAQFDAGSTNAPIIAITPANREGVSRSTPLGQLKVRVGTPPEDLEPYKFYRSLPTSIGNRTVLHSVFISLIASAVFAAAGLAPIVFAALFLPRSPEVSLFMLGCAVLMAPVGLPIGVGGIVTGIRFLRLPPKWRAPERATTTT